MKDQSLKRRLIINETLAATTERVAEIIRTMSYVLCQRRYSSDRAANPTELQNVAWIMILEDRKRLRERNRPMTEGLVWAVTKRAMESFKLWEVCPVTIPRGTIKKLPRSAIETGVSLDDMLKRERAGQTTTLVEKLRSGEEVRLLWITVKKLQQEGKMDWRHILVMDNILETGSKNQAVIELQKANVRNPKRIVKETLDRIRIVCYNDVLGREFKKRDLQATEAAKGKVAITDETKREIDRKSGKKFPAKPKKP